MSRVVPSNLRSASLRRVRGFSLIEMAIALAILSVVVLLLLRTLMAQTQTQLDRAERALIQRADHALTGFAVARYRFPCPDTDRDGREDCADQAQAGFLPFRDLGLPDAQAGHLRYGVMRYDPGSDRIDLAVAADRYYPLLVQTLPPVGATMPLGHINGLDLCHQLRRAAHVTSSDASTAAYLHTLVGAAARPVAYALAGPGVFDEDGDGSPFDGPHATGAAAFVSPQALARHDRDDRILAVSPGQVWARLQCGEAMAAAGHAHPNVANAAMILSQASIDYARVVGLLVDLAEAKIDSATAAVLTSTAGLTMALAKSAIATAQTLLSMGAMAPVIAASVAAVVANTAAVTAAGIALGVANDALDSTEQVHAQSIAYRQAIATLSGIILQRAREADQHGIF